MHVSAMIVGEPSGITRDIVMRNLLERNDTSTVLAGEFFRHGLR